MLVAIIALSSDRITDWIIEEWYLSKLRSVDEAEKKIAAEKLAEMRSIKAVPVLIELFEKEPGEPRHLPYSAKALVKIGEPAVSSLIEELVVRDRIPWRCVSYTLKDIGRPAVPDLVSKLKSDDAEVRRLAAHTLGKMRQGAEAAVPALIELLKDPNQSVRLAVAEAFPGIGKGAKAAAPALVEALRDDSYEVRRTAALSLAKTGCAPEALTRVVEALRKCLEDDHEGVQVNAAVALRKIESGRWGWCSYGWWRKPAGK